jgi:phospholipid-binding lipoprotein MlaA
MRAIPAVLTLAFVLSGCVTYPNDWDRRAEGPDPYEGSNRKVFAFNEGMDRYFLEPIATGWDFVTFQGMRNSIDKIFMNLAFPRRFLANLGQGEVTAATSEVGRFVLNTTVGLAGIFDPATHIGMPLYDEDFGQMFGSWGIGAGPYWVLPVFGPSNPRDTAGLVFDLAFDLRTIASFTPVFTLVWTGVVQNVNRRAQLDADLESAREAALDFYVFSRDAYMQRRSALVANEHVGDVLSNPDHSDDDLYYTDDDLYDLPESSPNGDD